VNETGNIDLESYFNNIKFIYGFCTGFLEDGRKFITYTSCEEKEEGEAVKVLYNSSNEAISKYIEMLKAKPRFTKIYVRMKPELKEINGKFTVYSRLILE